MSETYADSQFELLEAAYNEIPIEAKAHIEQLESSLDEVAEKWAIAQVNYEDCVRRNTLLEALIRDMIELDQMHHLAFSWERQEKAWNLRGSINARLIKMGFVKEGGDAE